MVALTELITTTEPAKTSFCLNALTSGLYVYV